VVLHLSEFHLLECLSFQDFTYIYWLIEYTLKALYDKVFELAKITYICWPIECTLKVLFNTVLELARITSIY
jgi:hypothetical protein